MIGPARLEFHRRILLGLDGLTPSRAFLDLLGDFELGGVMLFKRNVESPSQVASLTRELQRAAGERLVVAIDHEGGRVQRLGPPFTALPKGALVGRTGSTELAFELGRLAARELAAVGVNLNFAPVVLRLPPGVSLVSVDLTVQLEQLAFLAQEAAAHPPYPVV